MKQENKILACKKCGQTMYIYLPEKCPNCGRKLNKLKKEIKIYEC